MSEADEENIPWDGTERRQRPQPLAPETLEVLTGIQQSNMAVAEAMVGLTDALTTSVIRQGRGIRNWMVALSVAVFVIGVVVIWGRVEGARTGSTVREALAVSQANNEAVAYLASCLQDEGSDCFDRIRRNEQQITDADRKMLAQEIVCFAFRSCPPGMTPENIPDLEGLVLVPEPPEGPEGGTTTTTTP